MKLKNEKELSLSTKIAQALHYNDPETGSVVPSIEHTATYSRDENYEPRQAYWYRRDGNKTTKIAEEIITELENADASLLFSSGMSACTAVLEMLRCPIFSINQGKPHIFLKSWRPYSRCYLPNSFISNHY